MHLQSRAVDGFYKAIWEAFSLMKYLLSYIIRAKALYEYDIKTSGSVSDDEGINLNDRHIRTLLNNCYRKLIQYYKLIDETPIYTIFIIFTPGQRCRFLDIHKKRLCVNVSVNSEEIRKKVLKNDYLRQAEIQSDDNIIYIFSQIFLTRLHYN